MAADGEPMPWSQPVDAAAECHTRALRLMWASAASNDIDIENPSRAWPGLSWPETSKGSTKNFACEETGANLQRWSLQGKSWAKESEIASTSGGSHADEPSKFPIRTHQLVPRTADLAKQFRMNVKDGQKVTTVMIRNVPNRYSRDMLMHELGRLGLDATYDFFYLPVDSSTKWNVGYAFVNFEKPEDAARCMKALDGYEFRHRTDAKKKNKPAYVSVAHIQGLEQNLAHLTGKMVLSTLPPLWRPWVKNVQVDLPAAEYKMLLELAQISGGNSLLDHHQVADAEGHTRPQWADGLWDVRDPTSLEERYSSEFGEDGGICEFEAAPGVFTSRRAWNRANQRLRRRIFRNWGCETSAADGSSSTDSAPGISAMLDQPQQSTAWLGADEHPHALNMAQQQPPASTRKYREAPQQSPAESSTIQISLRQAIQDPTGHLDQQDQRTSLRNELEALLRARFAAAVADDVAWEHSLRQREEEILKKLSALPHDVVAARPEPPTSNLQPALPTGPAERGGPTSKHRRRPPKAMRWKNGQVSGSEPSEGHREAAGRLGSAATEVPSAPPGLTRTPAVSSGSVSGRAPGTWDESSDQGPAPGTWDEPSKQGKHALSQRSRDERVDDDVVNSELNADVRTAWPLVEDWPNMCRKDMQAAQCMANYMGSEAWVQAEAVRAASVRAQAVRAAARTAAKMVAGARELQDEGWAAASWEIPPPSVSRVTTVAVPQNEVHEVASWEIPQTQFCTNQSRGAGKGEQSKGYDASTEASIELPLASLQELAQETPSERWLRCG